MGVVVVDQLRVVYANKDGDRVGLDGVSLDIGHESIALLGPNGAGKSTLMGVLAGTIDADEGTVERKYEHGMGVVFQTIAIDELLTVRENLQLAGALHGMGRVGGDSIASAMESVVKKLDLMDRLDQQVRHLSGGLKRRADLARALLPGLGLLLLDEPTSGLDVEARALLWSSLDSIRNESKMAVVFATHLTDEAAKADRVVVLAEGKVVADGAPAALIDQLGTLVLRVRTKDAEAVERWCKEIGCPSVSRGNEVLISHVQPEYAGRCPGEPESVTLAGPTLEDVYLWHARSSFSGGAE